MIELVDEGIRVLFELEVLQGAEVEVVFDAPSEEWAERRNAPTVNVFLIDIREDLQRRAAGRIDLRDGNGRISAQARPARWFTLSYLVTAWAQRPEDEHRILASLLHCLARHETMPSEYLNEASGQVSLQVQVAQPRSEAQNLAEVWSTLGHRWRAALDLLVTIPVDLQAQPPAPVVTEQPQVLLGRLDPTHESADQPPRPARGTGGAARARRAAGTVEHARPEA